MENKKKRKIRDNVIIISFFLIFIASGIFSVLNNLRVTDIVSYYSSQGLFDNYTYSKEEKISLLKELEYDKKKGIKTNKDDDYMSLYEKFNNIPSFKIKN